MYVTTKLSSTRRIVISKSAPRGFSELHFTKLTMPALIKEINQPDDLESFERGEIILLELTPEEATRYQKKISIIIQSRCEQGVIRPIGQWTRLDRITLNKIRNLIAVRRMTIDELLQEKLIH